MKHYMVIIFCLLMITQAFGCKTLMPKEDPELASIGEDIEKDNFLEPKTNKQGTDAFGTRPASLMMPLNLGNTWEYQANMLGEISTLKVTIIKRDEKGFFIDNHGGKFKLTSFGLRDENRYLLMSPLEQGQKWRVQVSHNIAEHFEVIEDNKTVTVPAGMFKHCLVVRSVTRVAPGVRMVNTITYAPKVGMVINQTDMENDRNRKAKQVKLVLKSYSIP